MMERRVLIQADKPIPELAVTEEVVQAGGFDCPTQLVGKGSWVGQDGGGVNVYFEPSTGSAGQTVAQNILQRMDALMAYCDTVFGVRGKSGNVIVCSSPFGGATNGNGGAYHYGCAFNADGAGSDWYEDLASGKPDLTFGLVMAEVSESYMGLQRKGWNCGGSGGEGLSRYLAEIVSGGPNGSLSGFASAAAWNGTDWISRDQGTDQDYPSIGCAVLYCWWMTSLGFTPAQIVQAGEPDRTLASNYEVLTHKPKSQAFADFRAAVATVGHSTDNPWNVATPPYPLGGGGGGGNGGGGGTPPGPTPTKLFRLTFPHFAKDSTVGAFRTPVNIPANSTADVYPPGHAERDTSVPEVTLSPQGSAMYLNDAEKESAIADLQSRLQQHVGFDPSIIIAIIDAVLGVLRNVCPPKPAPAPAPGPSPVPSIQEQCQAALGNGGLLARLRLRRSMREHGVPTRDIPASMDAVFRVGGEASDDDVSRIYACVE